LNWGSQTIQGIVGYDDNIKAWEGDYPRAVATEGQQCSVLTRSAPVRIFAPGHDADKIQLSVRTTQSQYSGEEHGFTDVVVGTLSLPAEPKAAWEAGNANFGAVNQDGWGGTTMSPAFCGTLPANSLWVGSDSSTSGAMVGKMFTDLPDHQALRIKLT